MAHLKLHTSLSTEAVENAARLSRNSGETPVITVGGVSWRDFDLLEESTTRDTAQVSTYDGGCFHGQVADSNRFAETVEVALA